MAVFGQFFPALVSLLSVPLTLYGHTFSLWQVYLFLGFATAAIGVMYAVFGGD